MEINNSFLTPAEFEQLKAALAERYPNAKGILGSQLGAFVRLHLENPDLKTRFGGLKRFVAHSFPAEIIWRGRKGLDDLYDISFSKEELGKSLVAWQAVSLEPSLSLWSAVTNPSIYVQFAWSPKENSLLQASAGIPLDDGLVAVEKLTKTDYQNIATRFVDPLDSLDLSLREKALEASRSSIEFTKLIREQGLLAKWEGFRIDHAVRLFTERMAAAGVESEVVAHWAERLRLSQQQARSRRLEQTAHSAVQRSRAFVNPERVVGDVPEIRSVAIKAIEFLSDTEINTLSLPLGSVMRAFELLLKR